MDLVKHVACVAGHSLGEYSALAAAALNRDSAPMNLTDILSDETLRQHEFPVTRDKIFLSHAGVCPLPRCVSEAVASYVREAGTGDQEHFIWPGVIEDGRKLGAQLLNCQPEEVAFVGPTSLSLSLVCWLRRIRRKSSNLSQAQPAARPPTRRA